MGAWGPEHTLTSGHTKKAGPGSVTGLPLSAGDSGPKPLKGLGSNPDLELLLRTSQPEEKDNEAERIL